MKQLLDFSPEEKDFLKILLETEYKKLRSIWSIDTDEWDLPKGEEKVASEEFFMISLMLSPLFSPSCHSIIITPQSSKVLESLLFNQLMTNRGLHFRGYRYSSINKTMLLMQEVDIINSVLKKLPQPKQENTVNEF